MGRGISARAVWLSSSAGLARGTTSVTDLTQFERMESTIDLSLLWLWRHMADAIDDEDTLFFAWKCCRAAYSQGYIDSFVSPDPAKWFHEHGYQAPAVKA